MKHFTKKVLICLGYFFCGIALIGLFVPLMPSWPFALIGIILIGEESVLGQRLYHKLPVRIQHLITKARKTFSGSE